MSTCTSNSMPSKAMLKDAINKMRLREKEEHSENIEFGIAIYALERELERRESEA